MTTSLAVDHLHAVRHVWGRSGLALTYNSGFAFSLFSGRGVLVTVVLCIGVVVLAFVVAQVRTLPLAVGSGLVLGGAVGNLSERIVGGPGGQVPDFITLRYWPTFNLADACVTIGVIIIIVALLFGARAPVRPKVGGGRVSGHPDPGPVGDGGEETISTEVPALLAGVRADRGVAMVADVSRAAAAAADRSGPGTGRRCPGLGGPGGAPRGVHPHDRAPGG